jgi:hypothetical protein
MRNPKERAGSQRVMNGTQALSKFRADAGFDACFANAGACEM